MKKKILCLALSIIILISSVTITSVAIENEYIYLSISFDGEYIYDKSNKPIVYIPVELDKIKKIDLAEYGLENMLYDADGDGEYETTALQLLIYAHEELYGGDWGDVNFDAIPGASYFKGGIFGFTENLMYFHNGDFPVDESQASDYMTIGATSDRIVLEDGDFIDVASFTCFSFLWDTLGGFHFFADEHENYSHDFELKASETKSIKLMHSFCDLMFGEAYIYGAADYEIYYGKTYGKSEGTLTTDSDGNFEVSIDKPGTYYLWCNGANGSDDGTHSSCDYLIETGTPCIVSAPAYAKITITGEDDTLSARQPQDVSAVLNATMAQLANTVTEPSFGTNAGEWTVFSLARGEYFDTNNAYFTDYYNRITETVNKTASSVNLNGALDKNKSTENSRLIVALSAIGKDATKVGDWNLIEPYSANGINWIKKQGINGTIWTLIALDSNNYETDDPTIRQLCVDAILDARHDDGGWSLITAKAQPSNVDITCMALTALYPYRNQTAVDAACEEAINWLSESQLATGGFPYGNGETSESCSWAIVALTTWGINPDTDVRFIKNGKSAVDNLLTYYVEADRMFAHQGTEPNAMATDQSCYALISYNRFINGKPSLFDNSDITISEKEEIIFGQPKARLDIPAEISDDIGTVFNASISIDQWDNEAEYKLIDIIINVPEGLNIASVTESKRLNGGTVSYNLEEDTGKLRIVYFDPNNHSSINVTGNSYPAELFTISFMVENVKENDKLPVSVSEMTIKRSSDPSAENSLLIISTEETHSTINVVKGVSFSAVTLYTGDGVDLIPSDKKAVAVAVTGIAENKKLNYSDGYFSYEFLYSVEISEKTGVPTYIALVDSEIDLTEFTNKENYSFSDLDANNIIFGDANNDGIINAQDALSAVDTWLRKINAPDNNEILSLNVNSDSRINTFDALGIVEAFIDGSEFIIITEASKLQSNP